MRIHINGKPRECPAQTTLQDLLDQAGYGSRRMAVEINRCIVPRSTYPEHILNEGDCIEIVQAVGGG